MKIVILTQYYAPDPPSWIPTGLTRELSRRGHDVRVVTTFPHYESGRIAEGFSQTKDHLEYDESVPVRRVRIIPSHSRNPFGRVANYLSFVRSATAEHDFIRDADVVYAYGTPMTVAEPARRWRKKWGIPYVVHVQDVWPESVTGSGFLAGPLNSVADRVITKWISKVYEQASGVIAISPSMKDLLIARGANRDHCELVMNWSNDADGVKPNRVSGDSAAPRETRLLYAGNLGSMQDLETVIRAVHEVRQLDGLSLKIAGFGVEEQRLKYLVRELEATNVEFLGKLSPAEMINQYEQTDFQVVPLKDLSVFRGIMPSKIAAGLANGVPVITTVAGDVADLVQRESLGLTARPEDVGSLAQALRDAHNISVDDRAQLNARSRRFYESEMSRSRGVDRIETHLEHASRDRMDVRSNANEGHANDENQLRFKEDTRYGWDRFIRPHRRQEAARPRCCRDPSAQSR